MRSWPPSGHARWSFRPRHRFTMADGRHDLDHRPGSATLPIVPSCAEAVVSRGLSARTDPKRACGSQAAAIIDSRYARTCAAPRSTNGRSNSHLHHVARAVTACLPLSVPDGLPPQQLRQLGDIRRDAPRLVLGHELGGRSSARVARQHGLLLGNTEPVARQHDARQAPKNSVISPSGGARSGRCYSSPASRCFSLRAIRSRPLTSRISRIFGTAWMLHRWQAIVSHYSDLSN